MSIFIDRNIDCWRMSSGSKLEYAAAFRRLNHKPLRWEWQPGGWIEYIIRDQFRLPDENFFGRAHPSFSFRVMQEEPCDAVLQVEFWSGDQVSCSFEFGLDFRGWRWGWVSYWRDMVGRPGETLDRMRINAPHRGRGGAICFDEILVCSFLDPRLPIRDAQLPLNNSAADFGANRHWMGLYDFSLRRAGSRNPAPPSSRERADMRNIERYVTQHFVNLYKASAGEDNLPGRIMEELGLKRKFGHLSGPPPMYGASLDIYPSRIKSKYRRLMAYCDIEKYFSSLFDLAGRIRYAENDAAGKELQEFCLELLEFMRFHGWEEGSGQGTLRHFGFVIGKLAPALLLMKDFLQRKGELDRWRRILRWLAGTGRIYLPANALPGESSTILQTEIMAILISILIDGNENTRRQDLDCFRGWLDNAFAIAPGLHDLVKPDGAIFHHANFYPYYGLAGLHSLLPVVYALGGTGFDLSESSWSNLVRAVMTARLYCNPRELPMALAGRLTSGYGEIQPEMFYYLSLAARKRGDDGVAVSAADAFIRLTDGANEDCYNTERLLLSRQGATAETLPSGTWVMSYGCLILHRRPGWLAAIRGHNRYLWRSEIYGDYNLYGRYQTFGTLEIMPNDPSRLSFRHDGWDWNRWPGTTVPVKPLRALRADLRQLDESAGFEEMLLSPETFAGGCSINQNNGLFAMILRGHPKYERGFVARKSYFCCDDFIVCLGSGINSGDRGSTVNTNIFQTRLPSGAAAGISSQMMNGSNLNIARIDSCGTPSTWLTDTCGNGYYLPSGEFTVTFGRQTSRSWDDSGDTEGEFSCAWFEHGVEAQNASYEYAVLPQGGDRVADFAQAMATGGHGGRPYTVLRQDLGVHAVRFGGDALIGIAMFNAGLTGVACPVGAVDKPALLLLHTESDGVRLAVCNPDLNLYQGDDADQFDENGNLQEVSVYSRPWLGQASRPAPLRVELSGHWRLDRDYPYCRQISRSKSGCVLEFACIDGMPLEVYLREG